jgi:biotin synthase
MEIRNDWTREEIREIYHSPLLDLIYRAATVHRQYNKPSEVQVCTLLSVKTGGCPEDCAYCPQAARYHTNVGVEKLMEPSQVIEAAKQAKANGSTRFCMGAAWREVRNNRDFDKVLEMIRGVNELGLEVCATMGMVNEEQANAMAEAGLHSYNHNLDTSEEFYGEIITTRTYDERLKTLEAVRKSKVRVCSGGIIGMGETIEDRIGMLLTLSTLPQHPESVPVNALVPVEGTPLEQQPRVPIWDMARMVATARILMPQARVRLSAGRLELSLVEQAFLFMAGANSIFAGDKLLTTPNNPVNQDQLMFELLGLSPMLPENRKETVQA